MKFISVYFLKFIIAKQYKENMENDEKEHQYPRAHKHWSVPEVDSQAFRIASRQIQ